MHTSVKTMHIRAWLLALVRKIWCFGMGICSTYVICTQWTNGKGMTRHNPACQQIAISSIFDISTLKMEWCTGRFLVWRISLCLGQVNGLCNGAANWFHPKMSMTILKPYWSDDQLGLGSPMTELSFCLAFMRNTCYRFSNPTMGSKRRIAYATVMRSRIKR